jgi:aminoglycoside phosphotransferase (APT) family kinase protein
MHLFGVDLLYPDRQSLDAVHNDTITFFTYLCRGGSIPQVLIEKAEEYLPDDIRFLIKFVKDDDGDSVYVVPSWIHSDIMDDNILIEGTTEPGTSTDCIAVEDLNKMDAIHIIDFSDLSIGDPLCDLIPLHLDVFRGDIDLLRQFLRSYQLPFLRAESNKDIYKSIQNSKFSRASYRAMYVPLSL